jgi:hypothetical protein
LGTGKLSAHYFRIAATDPLTDAARREDPLQ